MFSRWRCECWIKIISLNGKVPYFTIFSSACVRLVAFIVNREYVFGFIGDYIHASRRRSNVSFKFWWFCLMMTVLFPGICHEFWSYHRGNVTVDKLNVKIFIDEFATVFMSPGYCEVWTCTDSYGCKTWYAGCFKKHRISVRNKMLMILSIFIYLLVHQWLTHWWLIWLMFRFIALR